MHEAVTLPEGETVVALLRVTESDGSHNTVQHQQLAFFLCKMPVVSERGERHHLTEIVKERARWSLSNWGILPTGNRIQNGTGYRKPSLNFIDKSG